MAVALSTQLERLERERDRLEELLMLDANWRALRLLDAQEATGDPLRVLEGQGQRDGLLKALGSNRIFAARASLIETIELLASGRPADVAARSPDTLASRIVLLNEPMGEQFRARLRMKPSDTAPVSPAPQRAVDEPDRSKRCQTVMPDALELIEGLGRRAVEQLLDGGVTRFAEIANWTSADVSVWRARLDGLAQGQPGWWIEQAAVLATGRLTRFAARARRGEYASLVQPPEPEPPRLWSPDRDASIIEPRQGLASLIETSAVPAPPELAGPMPLVPAVPSRLTAEDLARALAASAASQPPELAAFLPGSTSTESRPASARPPVRRADGSGVHVVTREPPAIEPGITADGTERPRRLLQRLKTLQATQRFDASSYAAYRGRIEEASVTILSSAGDARSEPAAKPDSVGSDAARSEPVSAPASTSRFLRALTGKP